MEVIYLQSNADIWSPHILSSLSFSSLLLHRCCSILYSSLSFSLCATAVVALGDLHRPLLLNLVASFLLSSITIVLSNQLCHLQDQLPYHQLCHLQPPPQHIPRRSTYSPTPPL